MGDGGAFNRGVAALEKAKPLFNGGKKKEAADLYKVSYEYRESVVPV